MIFNISAVLQSLKILPLKRIYGFVASTDLFHKEFDKFGTLTSSLTLVFASEWFGSQLVSSSSLLDLTSLASREPTDFMIIKIVQKFSF